MARSVAQFEDPLLKMTWEELQAIHRTGRINDVLNVDIELGYPVESLQTSYASRVGQWIGDDSICVDFKFKAPLTAQMPGVRNVIAVASGKGGVGKSTIAVNLAFGLSRAGSKVGLLDADIYGPSQGVMLGIPTGGRPQVVDGKFFEPIDVQGVYTMSMSVLTSSRTPMVWRGPMASGALQQMLKQTKWPDLDYLVVDLPPGTGDIHLTLSQQVSIGGSVIVTTPQDIALADARKGIEMFNKVDVPILGIVENMSFFECDGCGKKHDIFSSGGGAQVAEEYQTQLVGQFPLAPVIRKSTDDGTPLITMDPESELSQSFTHTARLVAARLWQHARAARPPPTISME